MSSRCPILLALTFAALALAGCTSSQTSDTSKDFTGEQRAVAKVIENLESAAAKTGGADTGRICSKLLTGELAEKIAARDSKKNCSQALEDPLSDVTAAGFELDVVKNGVAIKGDNATAKVKNGGDSDEARTFTYGLVKGRDGWRIDSY